MKLECPEGIKFLPQSNTALSPHRSVARYATEADESPAGTGRDDSDLDSVWALFKASGDSIPRNRLIEAYYPIVRFISERLLTTLPRNVQLDDLTSAGLFGLMDAINGFDLSRGVKFKTYCGTRIRGAILDDLRRQDWVPRLVRSKAKRVGKATKTLGSRLHRQPSEEEVATELQLSMADFRDLVTEATPPSMFSLSDKLDARTEEGGLENCEVIADKSVATPSDTVHRRGVIELLTRRLTTKEKQIIIMYYYEGMTMKSIGRLLDLTESRICQIHGNVMVRLRAQFEGKMDPM